MLRNLLAGRYRSMVSPKTAAAGPFGVALLRTTGANPTFDPLIQRVGGVAPTWDMGDTTQYASTDSVSHSYAAPGDYEVRWDMVPADLKLITFGSDDITVFTTQPTWVNMTGFALGDNPIGNVTLRKEWASIHTIGLNITGATAFDFHVEWTQMKTFSLEDNPAVVTIPTFSAWTLMEVIDARNNTSLENIVFYSAWTVARIMIVKNCNLSAATIDALLIALDSTGATNGTLAYETNPGSADPSRSGAAATAKANLVTKSWSITN